MPPGTCMPLIWIIAHYLLLKHFPVGDEMIARLREHPEMRKLIWGWMGHKMGNESAA